MNKIIKGLSVFIALAMVMLIFAGCQNKDSVGSSAVVTESKGINNESINQSFEEDDLNSDAPYIGENGNWWINGVDTGLIAVENNTSISSNKDNSSDKKTEMSSKKDNLSSKKESSSSKKETTSSKKNSTSSKNNRTSSKRESSSSKKQSSNVKKESTSSKTLTSSKTESATISSTASKPASDNGVNKTGWPIVNQKITIEYMGIEGTGYATTNDMSSFKYYESKTNVHFEFIGVAENQIESRKALAFKSGDLPDIFGFYSNSFTDYEIYMYGKEGVFVDIAPYVSEYAPNIAEILKDANTYAANADREGHVYTLPTERIENNSENDPSTYKYWLNINKEWLLNLDKAVPTNPSEFLSVLRSFRDEDPNANGRSDEIPYAEWNWDANFITAPWGVYADDGNIGVDNVGKVYYSLATEQASQATKFWHTVCNEKGLVDVSSIGNGDNNYAAFRAKIASGKVGCFRWSDLGSATLSPNILKQYVAIPYLSANFNSLKYDLPKSCQPFNRRITRSSIIITKKCKNVEAVLRYYDFLTTDDGIMLMNFGTEDAGLYKKLSDGSYELTTNNLANRYKQGLGWRIGIQEWPVSKLSRDSLSGDATYYEYAAKADKVYRQAHKKSPTTYFVDVFKTAEELAQIEKYDYFSNNSSGAMAAYLNGYQNGTLGNWETDVREYENKGLADYLELWQGIVDANKRHLYNSF